MRWLYNLSVGSYANFIRLSSPLNRKAFKWTLGRRGLFKKLEESKVADHQVVWVHCASLGEFEQARPIIERIKKEYPDERILLTFFSPSGYEIRKDYENADFIFYLPEDTRLKAKKFLDLVKPKAAVFVKYEFWPNYMLELQHRNIPLISVSTILRPEQRFFKWYGGWFRQTLRAVNHFFVQNQTTADLLSDIGLDNSTVTGDTRFDRVAQVAQNIRPVPMVELFAENSLVIIAGSSWPQEEAALARFLKTSDSRVKLIIAPHEIHEGHIRDIEAQFDESIRFSRATLDQVGQSRVLIIDNMGMLSQLYQYGKIAVVGGGFGKGIHNILEAATFGMPVLFGPNFDKFQEAKDLIKLGAARSVKSPEGIVHALKKLVQNSTEREKMGEISGNYVLRHKGATEKIVAYLSDNQIVGSKQKV
ncbi:3-deoxy-D-manno-octulosonic acid transferase [Halocola ammonii]